MLFWCLIFGFVSVTVYETKTVKVCLMFQVRVVHFFGMLKKKSIYTKYLCLLSQKFFPGLPNLGSQNRCALNQYTTVQTDLKYPLIDTDIG